MGIKVLGADKRNTINWASGTSTEIFIYPSVANFAERNFLFRISTATVEAEESTFTFFKGITRHLMILKGKLELIHEGRYSKHLEPFDQDVFSGEWSTRSKGRVIDFNLMLKDGTTGSLKHHKVDSGKTARFTPAVSDYYFIYAASGNATLNGTTVKPSDLVRVENETAIEVIANEGCDLIEIEVHLRSLPGRSD